jgi:hypothetical protein
LLLLAGDRVRGRSDFRLDLFDGDAADDDAGLWTWGRFYESVLARVARFFLVQIPKWEKYTKLPRAIPNVQ